MNQKYQPPTLRTDADQSSDNEMDDAPQQAQGGRKQNQQLTQQKEAPQQQSQSTGTQPTNEQQSLQQQNQALQQQLMAMRQQPKQEGGRIAPVRQSRILDRPPSDGAKASSLKIQIELDLEVEVDLYARVKGDITIGLM